MINYRHFLLRLLTCEGNPSRQENPLPSKQLSDEDAFALLFDNRFTSRRTRKVVFSSFFWVALISLVGLIVFSILNAVRSTEYTYPSQPSIVTYHFRIDDPAFGGEEFFLNVKLTSILPAIMSHVPMKFEAELLPIDRDDSNPVPKFYYLILTGSNCAGYDELNRISDDTCMMRIYCNAGICRQHIDSTRYFSSGEFPLYLSTQPGFNGTVSSTGSEHIFIMPIETYFSNEHTRDGLVLAALALVAVLLFEGAKAVRRKS